MESVGTWWMWAIFAVVIFGMLMVDIFVCKSGHEHKVSLKEAGIWSAVWVTTALIFAAGLWLYFNETVSRAEANLVAGEFLTGYVLEKSLAVDNVFVWIMIFSFFSIPLSLQRRVLLYGIFGAIILRTIMIFAGSWLITQFHWILYLFGVFLIFTAIRMVTGHDEDKELSQNKLVLWMQKKWRVTSHLEGEYFFARHNGVLFVTPLFLALVLVELSDIVFAVDSIPAVFAITKDPFIVLTSNLFAILGLRAMYFLLAGVSDRFVLLKYGLAIILGFVGIKMLIVDWLKIPIGISLGFVVFVLLMTALLSLRFSKTHQIDFK